MFRFFKELFNRSLKCERVGHKPYIQEREGYRPTNEIRCVAESVKQRREICKRCKEPLSEWEDHRVRGLNGLTMSSDDFDRMYDEGAIWNSQRTLGRSPRANTDQAHTNSALAAGILSGDSDYSGGTDYGSSSGGDIGGGGFGGGDGGAGGGF